MTQLTLDQGAGRRAPCPCCSSVHALTLDGRLWTHGPRDRRCRTSQRTPESARAAARRPAPSDDQDALPLDTTPTPTSPCPGCRRPTPLVRGVYSPHPCPAAGLTPAQATAHLAARDGSA